MTNQFKKLLVPGKISQTLCLGNVTDNATLKYLQGIAPDYQTVKGEYDTMANLPLNKVVSHGQFRIGIVSGHSVIPTGDPDALLIMARQLDVDILMWGGSHKVEAYELEDKFFVSPGSATGAFYTGWEEDEYDDEEENEDNNNNNSGSNSKSKGLDDNDNDDADDNNKDKDNGKNEGNGDGASQGNTSKESEYDNVPSFCLLDVQNAICILYIYSLVGGEIKVDKVRFAKK